jgi:surface antigen
MSNVYRASNLALTAAFMTSLVLTGCAQHYSSPEQAASNACSAFGPRASSGALIGGVTGAAGGAAIGGLAGHSGTAALIGAGVGALAGVLAGEAIGHHLDQRDCAAAQIALQQIGNTPTGQPLAWSDPSTGSHGLFIPTAAEFTDPQSGLICRPINASYYLNGHKPVVGDTGNVCRSANGNWYRQVAGT